MIGSTTIHALLPLSQLLPAKYLLPTNTGHSRPVRVNLTTRKDHLGQPRVSPAASMQSSKQLRRRHRSAELEIGIPCGITPTGFSRVVSAPPLLSVARRHGNRLNPQ